MNAQEMLCRRCEAAGMLLQPPAAGQVYVRVTAREALRALAQDLKAQQFSLVTLVCTDERELIDNCFKLTYLFSHAEADLFLFVENPVSGTQYPSLAESFPCLDTFEREIADMMGLYPSSDGRRREVSPGSWLHECYPLELYPLRRDRSLIEIQQAVAAHQTLEDERSDQLPAPGEWLLPVGPIHAGVIEPGQFLFRLGGEVIEELTIRLGYTHKGIERLFQSAYSLQDGWRLAEHVCGDSAYAHSLAYCQAAEALAGVQPPQEAQMLRGLFLELERMANQIGDCGALAREVALAVPAAELSALRERLLRLNLTIAGHRLLRGLNRPGGICLPHPLDAAAVQRTVRGIADSFRDLAGQLVRLPAIRDRLQWTGILTREQALALGVTGLAARASGVRRDFRLQHPVGIYRDPVVRERVAQGLPPGGDSISAREATAGDCLARLVARVREVESSAQVIEYLLSRPEFPQAQTEFLAAVHFRPDHDFEFGLGHVEGWRGDIVYWLMQGKFGHIFRCKVRDPSLLNWPALKAAVEPHKLDGDYVKRYHPPRHEVDSIVPDFPIINKSFNLSYSGNDL